MDSTMTPQEVFDITVNHLRTQGKRAVGSAGYCLYRAPGGLKCAVGCHITDEEYRPTMEGHTARTLAVLNKLPARLVPHLALLYALQSIHDAIDWTALERKLENLAANYNLKYTPPGDSNGQ